MACWEGWKPASAEMSLQQQFENHIRKYSFMNESKYRGSFSAGGGGPVIVRVGAQAGRLVTGTVCPAVIQPGLFPLGWIRLRFITTFKLFLGRGCLNLLAGMSPGASAVLAVRAHCWRCFGFRIAQCRCVGHALPCAPWLLAAVLAAAPPRRLVLMCPTADDLLPRQRCNLAMLKLQVVQAVEVARPEGIVLHNQRHNARLQRGQVAVCLAATRHSPQEDQEARSCPASPHEYICIMCQHLQLAHERVLSNQAVDVRLALSQIKAHAPGGKVTGILGFVTVRGTARMGGGRGEGGGTLLLSRGM